MSNGGQSPSSIPTWRLYVAAGIGAFLLGVGDYTRHDTQSTVIALSKALGMELALALFLLAPVLGVVAAWIYRPGTERDAFALGLAVFSLFSLAPDQQRSVGVTKEFNTAPPAIETSFRLVPTAFADQHVTQAGNATVNLQFEGGPPPNATVSVRNLTQGKDLGVLTIEDSLKLFGRLGDRIELDFEAAGHQRTKVEVPLGDTGNVYEVPLPKNATPLFWQRLFPAERAEAIAAQE